MRRDITLHLEAERAHLTPPARQVFDGRTSGWRFVRVTKELETEKTARVDFDLEPGAGSFTLWMRARAGDVPGRWAVSLGDKTLGEVAVDHLDWKWVKLAGPVTFGPGMHRLTLHSGEDGLAVDKIILTTDERYVPKTLDDRFRVPPKKVEFLIAKEVTDSSARITWWNPRAEADLAYYNVYVGDSPDFPCDQAHVIASTEKGEALDWGLEAGRSYTYKVVAVSRRGLASEPSGVTVKTAPLAQKVLLAFSIDQAKLDPRLVTETRVGKRYAFLPGKAPDAGDGASADITWDFTLGLEGDYVIWCQYAPADGPETAMNVPVSLDGPLDGKTSWRMRLPYRDIAGASGRERTEDLWFTDKVTMESDPAPLDLLKLSAGAHRLTVGMSAKAKEPRHKIAFIWITNDLSFRPSGWDPQADFTKERIERK
jgi:hypothetical protein